MRIVLNLRVNTVLEKLNLSGFEAYVVGGCVRDSILEKEPNDWDVCTSAKPEQVLDVFNGYKTVIAGIKHGTVGVLIDKQLIEITTYRVDGKYTDNRHPESVSFTTQLHDDLSRRDFTINAMAYSPQAGLVDFFGGIDDINKKQIKCVGNPDERFNEDALRIARAIRFSAQLEFSIEQNTHNSILKNKNLLKNIAAERIRTEFDKLLCQNGAVKALDEYRDVIAIFMPQITPMINFDQKNYHHCYDVWQHTLVAIKNAEPILLLRLSLLFHDIGKPHCFTTDQKGIGHFYGHAKISSEITEKIMRSLKYDNETINNVIMLVKAHDIQLMPEPQVIKRCLNKIGEQNLRLLLKLKRCDNLAQHPNYRERAKTAAECEDILDEIFKKNQCFSLKQLAVTGEDLIKLGIPQGKRIGENLNYLLHKVMDGECKNQKDELLLIAKKKYKI